MLKEIEQCCQTDTDLDSTPLHHLMYLLWPLIREKFPIQMRSAEVSRIPPNGDEIGSAYLLRVRELWQDRTGEDHAVSDTIEKLFRGVVEASLSPSVKSTLKQVVGLTNLTYALWAAHVTQYNDHEI